MSEPIETTFTDEEICRQAMGNASTLPYLLAAYARHCGRTPDDAAAFTGRLFAPGWDEVQGQGALAVVRWMALNLVSGGMTPTALTGDETQAEARVRDDSAAEMAAFFGVSEDDAARFFEVFTPITERLGCRFSWTRDGSEPTLRVSRPAARSQALAGRVPRSRCLRAEVDDRLVLDPAVIHQGRGPRRRPALERPGWIRNLAQAG